MSNQSYPRPVVDYCCNLPYVFSVGSDGFYETCQLSEQERQKYDSALAPLGYELVPDSKPGHYFVGERITREPADDTLDTPVVNPIKQSDRDWAGYDLFKDMNVDDMFLQANDKADVKHKMLESARERLRLGDYSCLVIDSLTDDTDVG